MSDPTGAAQGINTANKSQTSQALIIQTYCNSVKEQPLVDFTGHANLAIYQTQINSGLQTAQSHADNYLNTIQPSIISNIANISNFYALNNAVATTLPAGSTEQQWIEALTALQTQSAAYQQAASGVVTSLTTLRNNLTSDASSFATTVSNLNTAVNGDNGVLAADASELDTIQSKIDGAIAGIVTSGLAIVGGAFMIAVGGIADFVTGGTSTPVVLGGIAIVVAGVGGEAASAVALASLNNQKAALLQDEAKMTAEVKLATGISSGYQSLGAQVKNAVDAATAMKNAWDALGDDIGSMIGDLKQGIQSVDTIRTIFLTAANGVAKTVLADVETIKQQMAGITTIVATPGQTVGQAIVAAANAPQFAARA